MGFVACGAVVVIFEIALQSIREPKVNKTILAISEHAIKSLRRILITMNESINQLINSLI